MFSTRATTTTGLFRAPLLFTPPGLAGLGWVSLTAKTFIFIAYKSIPPYVFPGEKVFHLTFSLFFFEQALKFKVFYGILLPGQPASPPQAILESIFNIFITYKSIPPYVFPSEKVFHLTFSLFFFEQALKLTVFYGILLPSRPSFLGRCTGGSLWARQMGPWAAWAGPDDVFNKSNNNNRPLSGTLAFYPPRLGWAGLGVPDR
jgi:hypothetical protein